MKKIFDFIVSIPHDKLLHNLAGMLIALVALRVLAFVCIDGFFARFIAIGAVVAAAVLREIYNKRNGGVFDWKDMLYTVAGGLIVILLEV